MNNHYVYWYHLEIHNDPFNEGYIGVTNDINRRNLEHLNNIGKIHNHFYNALQHYGKENVILTILQEGLTAQEAYDKEYLYRPTSNIGWNTAPGGSETLGMIRSKPITIFHESNPEKEYSFDSITQCAKEMGIDMGRLQMAAYRKSNTYGRDGWAVLSENTDKTTIKTISQLQSELLKGKKKTYSNKWKGCTNRWSKEDKIRIGNQHRGKKIPRKQVENLIKINRHNKFCKPITLCHRNEPNTKYSFHSISEASRQLNIPLSRLKSKCLRKLGVYGKDGWAVLEFGSQNLSNEQV